MKHTNLFTGSIIAFLALTEPLHSATPTINFQSGLTDAIFKLENDSFFSTTTGYYFYGTFSTTPTASSTAQEIEDDFRQLGIAGDSANTTMSGYGDGKWSSTVTDVDFASQRGYLVVANNADIGNATQIAVATSSDSAWLFSDLTSPYNTTVSVNDLASTATGSSLIIGSYKAGTSSPETILLASVTAVPEPSSVALLGLGAVAFAFRRRK